MILKFIGRNVELDFLEKAYAKKGLQVIVVYGRRRSGKTELIKKFIEQKEAIYFLADQRGTEKNIERFTKDIEHHFDLDPLKINNFEGAFSIISKNMNSKRLVVVIDEFSYLIEKEPALKSVFQYIIDEILQDKNIFLILCGSSIGMMEKGVLSYKSPLYGRRTGQIRLTPLPFEQVQEFFPKYPIEQAIEAYSILGGIPAYLNLFDPKIDLFTNIKDTFFIKEHLFYQEPEIILKEELREPKVYFNLLDAMAHGKTKLTDIANTAGINAKDVSPYISSLIELDLVERVQLVTEKKARSRKSIYRLKDNFFKFWFRFILENKEKIERGLTIQVLDEIKRDFSSYVGKTFENVCIDFLWKDQSFSFNTVGAWWGVMRDSETGERKNIEIDIVALNNGTKEVLFGECKWQKQKIDVSVYDWLLEKKEYVNWNNKKRKEYFAFFSKSGFTDEMKEVAQRDKLLLYDLTDIKRLLKR
jgi:AAA+ ATPase superfamily predicted ATPase